MENVKDMCIHKKEIEQLEQRYRTAFINSLAGFRQAVLIGAKMHILSQAKLAVCLMQNHKHLMQTLQRIRFEKRQKAQLILYTTHSETVRLIVFGGEPSGAVEINDTKLRKT